MCQNWLLNYISHTKSKECKLALNGTESFLCLRISRDYTYSSLINEAQFCIIRNAYPSLYLVIFLLFVHIEKILCLLNFQGKQIYTSTSLVVRPVGIFGGHGGTPEVDQSIIWHMAFLILSSGFVRFVK